ncbi:MAG: hypothetical protein WDW36_002801 [Sanguina aurantia]
MWFVHGKPQRQPLLAVAAVTAAAPPASDSRPLGNVTSSATDADLKQQMDDLIKGFSTQSVERGYWVEDSMVEGTIPAELEGTLLRNGPGIFEIGSRSIPQPFDGDGMVCSFAFKDGKAFFRNKLVRTEGFVAEQRAQKQLYRSAFNKGKAEGVWFNSPFDLAVKNVANTNVIHWGGKTLALYERGLPHHLDDNLTTVGTDDLAGSVDGNKFFGAHYRMVSQPDGSKRLIAFSAAEEGHDAMITLWEYDSDFKCLHKGKHTLKAAAFGFFHDLVVTEQYYVFVENPITLNLFRMVTEYTVGKACIAECLEFDRAKQNKVHVIARPGSAAAAELGPASALRTYTVPGAPFFTFHHSNGFEAGDGHSLVVDTCAFGYIKLGQTEPDLKIYRDSNNRDDFNRVVVNLETAEVSRHQVHQRNGDLPSISPHVQGLPSRYTYIVASAYEGAEVFGPSNSVWKVGMDPNLGTSLPFDRSSITQSVWTPGPGKIAQEPIFVPRSSGSGGSGDAEDDGWVMTMVYDATTNRSSLAILDAQRIEEGPVCSIGLTHHIPLGLHGSFTPAYLGPSPGAVDCCFEYDTKKGV